MKRFANEFWLQTVLTALAILAVWVWQAKAQAPNFGNCPCHAGGEACYCVPASICPNCPPSHQKSYYTSAAPQVGLSPSKAAEVPVYRTVCDGTRCVRVQVGSGTPPPVQSRAGQVAAAVVSSARVEVSSGLAFPRVAAVMESRPLVRLVRVLIHPFHRRCQ